MSGGRLALQPAFFRLWSFFPLLAECSREQRFDYCLTADIEPGCPLIEFSQHALSEVDVHATDRSDHGEFVGEVRGNVFASSCHVCDLVGGVVVPTATLWIFTTAVRRQEWRCGTQECVRYARGDFDAKVRSHRIALYNSYTIGNSHCQLGNGLVRPLWLARIRSGTRLRRDISLVSKFSRADWSSWSHSGGICLRA
jgi:hypothetical protein